MSGVFADSSQIEVYNSHFTGLSGLGIAAEYSTIVIRNNIIEQNNIGIDMGGGVWLFHCDSAFVVHSIIRDYFVNGGINAGILCWGGNTTILGNTLRNNQGTDIRIWSGIAHIRNNLIVNSWRRGSRIGMTWEPQVYLENNTIISNNSIAVSGLATGVNCIIRSLNPDAGQLVGAAAPFTYSNIQGGHEGAGNIDTDPLFLDTLDFYLSEESLCVDAGNPAWEYNDLEDPENPGYALYPSLGGLRNDMGAYGGPGEHYLNPPEIPQLTIPLQGNYFELISTPLIPGNLDAAAVFGAIDHLAIVYQDDGSIYIPPPININTIGEISITEGYKLFCREESELILSGVPLDPATEYTLFACRWNWLGYPFNSNVLLTTALSDILPEIVIVMTDDGRFYIPPPLNINTIENMTPGEGYMIFVHEDVTFGFSEFGQFSCRDAEPAESKSGSTTRTYFSWTTSS